MRCKKGELAWIVRSRYPENIGAIVKCVEYVGPTAQSWAPDTWHVLSTGRMLTGERSLTIEGLISDAYLCPLAPLTETTPVAQAETA